VQTIRAGRVLPSASAAPLGPSQVDIGDDGRIAAVRPVGAGALSASEARLMLMPALCNAHDHGRGLSTLAFGAVDQALETWLPDLARQPKIDPYLNAAVAFARLAESGVAAVNHCHNTQDSAALLSEAEAVSRAARDVGIAVAFAWPFFDRNPFVYGPLAGMIEYIPAPYRDTVAGRGTGFRTCAQNMALIEQAAAFEHPLFKIQYHPVAPQWAQDETLAAIAEASQRDGRRIHIHLLETERQREWADSEYPQGFLAFLDSIGLLSPRLTVAHAVWLRADECALLAKRGVTVSINLSSNLRLRSGLPPLGALAGARTPVAVGLDGMSLDDDQDMLRELRLVHHGFARPPVGHPAIDPAMILDGAIRIGRRTILGEDGGGRIAPGAPADLLALDFAALAYDDVTGAPDAIGLLLGRAQRRHVVRLIVGGREIVADGRCRTVDLPALESLLIEQARLAYRTSPPDEALIRGIQGAVCGYYEADLHR
jgi:cytosine/adenosine deaminase-related metal-dependent hydrolase